MVELWVIVDFTTPDRVCGCVAQPAMSTVEVARAREQGQKHAAPLGMGSSPAKLQSLALEKTSFLACLFLLRQR
jgi:hypothetical protein